MTVSPPLIDLTESANLPLVHVGGKAAALGRLVTLGAPVPPGFVVPPEVDLVTHSKAIQDALAELNAGHVAVRSSAAGEDSETQSWAGQFESYLYVSPAAVSSRIADCRASGSTARARTYANGANMPVAVVVQAMVASDAAGVLFTVNPVTKNPNELMIEAVWGLGELLVQGLATPDNYLVAKLTGELMDQTIAPKTVMMTGTDTGPAERPVPAARRTQAALTPPQLTQLTALAVNLERSFGHPLDIEFAYARGKLYILQARPITTL